MAFLKATFALCIALLVTSYDLRLVESHTKSRMKGKYEKPLIVTTLKTKYGDIYDCYDIYRQPSLSHPALVNHTIQLSPSTNYEEVRREGMKKESKKKSTANVELVRFGLERGCPVGSVPIRRHEPDQPSRISSPFMYFNQSKIESDHGFKFAGIFTAPKGEYHGTQGYCTVYRPSIDPTSQKYSSAIFSIQSGDQTALDEIQVGWTVNPILYPGDNNVRMFIFYKSALPGSPAYGCFNQLCSGFVHTNNDVAVDNVLPESPSPGPVEDQHEFAPYVEQDPKTKDWWLSLMQNSTKVAVGYWPHDLFKSLGNAAESIAWGGVVYKADSEQKSADMGSGKFVNGDYTRSAFFAGIQVLDNTFKYVVPPDSNIQTRQSFDCYFAGDQSYKERFDYSFVYGGAGDTDEECTPP